MPAREKYPPHRLREQVRKAFDRIDRDRAKDEKRERKYGGRRAR